MRICEIILVSGVATHCELRFPSFGWHRLYKSRARVKRPTRPFAHPAQCMVCFTLVESLLHIRLMCIVSAFIKGSVIDTHRLHVSIGIVWRTDRLTCNCNDGPDYCIQFYYHADRTRGLQADACAACYVGRSLARDSPHCR